MLRKLTTLLTTVLLLAVMQQSLHAASPSDDPYTLSVDPVGDSLVDVAKPVMVVHDGRQLLFASEKNVSTFKKDAKKYLDQVDALIIKQQSESYPLDTCVVSAGKLGEMGKPIEKVIGNRLVKFCCAGCISKVEKTPTPYFAKIDQAVIASQTKDYPLTTCIVSGEKLGEMGKPIEKVVGTQLVKFCCSGCIGQFNRNPAHYLAKLKH